MPKADAVRRTVTRTTKTEYSVTLSAEQIVLILNGDRSPLTYGSPPRTLYIPKDASLSIMVPSGADYSGDSLDLDEAGGLSIYWQETEKESV